MTDSYEELRRTRWAAEQTAKASQKASNYNRQTAQYASDSSGHASRAADAQEQQARAAQQAAAAQAASAEAHQQMAQTALQAQQDQLNFHYKMWLQTEDGRAFSRWSTMATEFLAVIDRVTGELPVRWNRAWLAARARVLPEGVSEKGQFGGQIGGIVMAVLGILEIARHLSTPTDLMISGPVSLVVIAVGIAVAVRGAKREQVRRSAYNQAMDEWFGQMGIPRSLEFPPPLPAWAFNQADLLDAAREVRHWLGRALDLPDPRMLPWDLPQPVAVRVIPNWPFEVQEEWAYIVSA
jgi:hypothetical protein